MGKRNSPRKKLSPIKLVPFNGKGDDGASLVLGRQDLESFSYSDMKSAFESGRDWTLMEERLKYMEKRVEKIESKLDQVEKDIAWFSGIKKIILKKLGLE